jgi:lipopolysaccharide transport system ATP-binding protein
MSDVVIRVENLSKLYRLGEVGTGSLAHDVNRWWHRVRGKEDPYLKIGEVNDRTKPAKQASSKKSLTTEDTESTEGAAGVRLGGQAGAEFPDPSTSELASDSENTSLIRSANAPHSSEEQSDSKALDSRPSTLVSAPKAQAPSDWVYALKDVSFEVKRGEVLGIIGRNGAGKSTLLKILSRVTTQSSGQIKVKGRIASLLEVGTGFHPELTGRENIFLNGAILGMRKAEIARKFDEIVEFSGCARYIDTPVKRYSSGMKVRLGFAVAAYLEPEILIVDEVLAVGDAEFQKKCLGKMKDVAGHGRTILFVSHNLVAMQNLCGRCLLMNNGRLEAQGETKSIIKRYLGEQRTCGSNEQVRRELELLPNDDAIEVLDIRVQQNDQEFPVIYTNDVPIFVRVRYRAKERTTSLRIFLDILDDEEKVLIRTFHDEHEDGRPVTEPGEYVVEAEFPADLLGPHIYELRVHATVHNVRRCMGLGVGIKIEVLSTNQINRAYPEQSFYAKLRPRIGWKFEKLERETLEFR